MDEGKIGGSGQEQEKETSPEVKKWIEKIKALQALVSAKLGNDLVPLQARLRSLKNEEVDKIIKEMNSRLKEVVRAPSQIEGDEDYREHFLFIQKLVSEVFPHWFDRLTAITAEETIAQKIEELRGWCQRLAQLKPEYLELDFYHLNHRKPGDPKIVDLKASLEAAERAEGEEESGE